MIETFKHRGLKRLYEKGDRSGVRADMADKIENILTLLDEAKSVEVLNAPSLRLHQLKGDLKGSARTGASSSGFAAATPLMLS